MMGYYEDSFMMQGFPGFASIFPFLTLATWIALLLLLILGVIYLMKKIQKEK